MLEAASGQIDRYLHLGEAKVTEGQRVRRGDAIGVIANAQESGAAVTLPRPLRGAVHRLRPSEKDYGTPIHPKFEVV